VEHLSGSRLLKSFYRSWNLREASLRAAEAQAQNALLSAHDSQLQNLGLLVQSGHTTILNRIESTMASGPSTASHNGPIAYHTRQGLRPRSCAKRPSARTLRLALPRWLSNYIWEFAVHELDGGWNFRVRSVNVRPNGSFVFDVVRSGNVDAVRKLLTSGELSVSDHECDEYEPWDSSLLLVSHKCLGLLYATLTS
jgi:hypothetical protein